MCLAGAGGDLQLIDYSKTSQGYGRTEEAGGEAASAGMLKAVALSAVLKNKNRQKKK